MQGLESVDGGSHDDGRSVVDRPSNISGMRPSDVNNFDDYFR